jgi:hypothetical protein
MQKDWRKIPIRSMVKLSTGRIGFLCSSEENAVTAIFQGDFVR